jgi:inorganic triphosphatase YgiF
MREIELKLAVAAADLPRTREALLAIPGAVARSPAALASTYFDTPELHLQRQELTLRVRREGRHFVQTVKGRDDGDLVTRAEWEDRIPGARPDLGAATSGARVQEVVKHGGKLRPLFTTDVRRTAVIIEPRPGTRIEAAIDEGEIRTLDGGSVAEPVSELELELKAGDPAMLYDTALRLLDVVPLRIETRTKSDRGFRLATGESTPRACHSQPTRLHPEMTVEEAFQAIGRRSLTLLLRNEPAALADLPEGVHQMRVALRRLRSAMTAVKPMLPEEHHRWAAEEMRWHGGVLAEARNWDVFAMTLLQPVLRALPQETALHRLAAAVEERRAAAHERARAAIGSQRYTASLLRLARWFEARGWRDQPVSEASAKLLAPIGEVAADLLARRYHALRKRGRHFATLSAEQRHSVRIALKKLRYGTEFLSSLFPEDKVAAFLKQLKPLQEDLGYANDVETARGLVVEFGKGAAEELNGSAGMVIGWHLRVLAEGEDGLRRHMRRVREAAPFW